MERAFAGPFCPMSKHRAVQSPSCRVNTTLQNFSWDLQGPTLHTYTIEPFWQIEQNYLFKTSIKDACWLIPSVGLEQCPTAPGTKSRFLRWHDALCRLNFIHPSKEWETHFCPCFSDRQTRRCWDVSGLRKEVRQLRAFTLHTKRVASNRIGERRMHWLFCCQALREYRLQIVTSDRPWQSSLSMTRSLMSGTPLYYGLVW